MMNFSAASFRRGEACSFNSDVNNSRDGIISYQERQCIKTALAFVVLRRRAAIRCTQRNSKPRQLSLESSELSSSESLRTSTQNDRKASSIIGFVEHLQSMMHVAIATAIPLYEHVVIHSLDNIVRSAASNRTEQEAIIYDYIAASSKLSSYSDSNSSSSKALSIYKILDGILQHVASQLTTKKRIARDGGADSAASETEMNNYFL